MKVLSKIIPLVAVMLIGLTACVEKEPDYSNFDSADVDFTYNVEGEEYTLDFYVVSTTRRPRAEMCRGILAMVLLLPSRIRCINMPKQACIK